MLSGFRTNLCLKISKKYSKIGFEPVFEAKYFVCEPGGMLLKTSLRSVLPNLLTSARGGDSLLAESKKKLSLDKPSTISL